MARAANLGRIGRRGLRERIEAKIEAEIAQGRAARDAMTGVLVAEDLKVAMKEDTKAVRAAVVAVVPSTISPKSSWRS